MGINYVCVDNDEELNELKELLFGTTNVILINHDTENTIDLTDTNVIVV